METVLEKIKLAKYNFYRYSGAEWMGDIPNNWESIKMKHLFQDVSIKKKPDAELLSVTQDQGVVPRTWVENRMVMPSGALESFKFINKGDFAISLRSFEGGLEYCHHDGIISPAYTVLKAKRNFDNQFYKYLFKSFSFISELQTSVVGIRQGKNISFEELSYSYLPIPPKEEQTAIAAFLDRKTALIDQAIGIKQKQIELLKERRQIFIHKAVTRGLNSNVKMKDSGVEWIGKIPEHWAVKRLKEICKAFGRIGFRGYTTSDLVNEGEGAITISPSNIKEEFMTFEKCSFLSWKKYHQSPEIQIFENDVLMVKTGSTFGKIGIVKNLAVEATINPQLLVFKGIKINLEYFYVLMKTSVVQRQVQTEVIGSTIPTISETKILNFKVVLPPKIEVDEIMSYIENIKNKIAAAISLKEKEIEKLKEYKTTLINSAVTGKIKVA